MSPTHSHRPFVDDYDIEAIADEICEWRDGKLTLVFDEGSELFWNIVAAHDKTIEAR